MLFDYLGRDRLLDAVFKSDDGVYRTHLDAIAADLDRLLDDDQPSTT